MTGLLFIVVPVAFNATFFILQRAFEYPDILAVWVVRYIGEGHAQGKVVIIVHEVESDKPLRLPISQYIS